MRAARGDRSVVPPWALGDVLAKMRRDAGVSMEDLARRARVSASTVSAIEAGRRDPQVGTVERIARALGYQPIMRFEPETRPRVLPPLRRAPDPG